MVDVAAVIFSKYQLERQFNPFKKSNKKLEASIGAFFFIASRQKQKNNMKKNRSREISAARCHQMIECLMSFFFKSMLAKKLTFRCFVS